MLIRITDDTAKAFSSMIPEEYLAPTERNGYFCIGSITDDEEMPVSQGLLVFEVVKRGKEISARLDWLYVAETFRRQRIGTALMEEFMRLVQNEKIGDIVCQIPASSEYDELVAFLDGHGFTFAGGQTYDFETTLGELGAVRAFQVTKAPDAVVALSQLGEIEWNKLMKSLHVQGFYGNLPVDQGAYDQTLSGVILRGARPEATCLVRREASGVLTPMALMSSAEKRSAELVALLQYSYLEAMRSLAADQIVHIKAASRDAEKLIAYFFPQVTTVAIRIGTYSGEA